jgi:hypothetical protein
MYERVAPIQNYILDRGWKSFLSFHAFPSLLRVLNKKVEVDTTWRETIRRAAILSGRSYLAKSVHEAFVLDMIAIETLLALRGEKFPDVLVERLNAFFGWLRGDETTLWKDIISRLYRLRCSYVHDGKSGDVMFDDLFYADMLLQNLLLNICRNPRHFSSKSAVVEFTRRIAARRVLGLKVRTKEYKLSFNSPHLTPARRKSLERSTHWMW